MYKLVKNDRGQVCVVNKQGDGYTISIPFDPANTDYQEYLKWVSEGNLPSPSDSGEPSPIASVQPLPAEK